MTYKTAWDRRTCQRGICFTTGDES